MLLSLFVKNLPSMLTPNTLRPESASMSRIVKTASYRIELPTFFDESVFVATCARMSLICSLIRASPLPSILNNRRILTCKNGSVIPVTSCSGAYPDCDSPFSTLTRLPVTGLNIATVPSSPSSSSSASHMLTTSVSPLRSTPWFLSFRSSFAFSMKCSCRSGTLRQILIAQSAAFRLIYGFDEVRIVSTSGKRSRAISTLAMFPSVHNARPTMYWLLWFKSLSLSACLFRHSLPMMSVLL